MVYVMMKKMGALFLAGMLSQWAMADAASVQSQLHKNYPSLKIENIKTTEQSIAHRDQPGDMLNRVARCCSQQRH